MTDSLYLMTFDDHPELTALVLAPDDAAALAHFSDCPRVHSVRRVSMDACCCGTWLEVYDRDGLRDRFPVYALDPDWRLGLGPDAEDCDDELLASRQSVTRDWNQAHGHRP